MARTIGAYPRASIATMAVALLVRTAVHSTSTCITAAAEVICQMLAYLLLTDPTAGARPALVGCTQSTTARLWQERVQRP
jgi:hypothetical protein